MDIPWADEWEVLEVNGRPVHAHYRRIRHLISAHLGEEDAGFLAVPAAGHDGGLRWSTVDGRTLAPVGDSVAAAGMTETAAATIARISELAERLATQGDAGRLAAHALRSALVTPEGAEALYTDGERPVLVLWGAAARGQARPEPPRLGPRAAEMAPEPSPAEPPPSARSALPVLWPWLVPLVLAAVTVLLAREALAPLPPTVVERIPPAPPAADPTAGLDQRLQELDRAIAEAEAALPRFAAVCVKPEPESAHCPSGQVARTPREIMLVLDASGSMAYSINTPVELERRLLATRNPIRAMNIQSQIRRVPGESRMSVAKRVLKDAITNAPRDVSIGLTSFHSCRKIRAHGMFGGGERGRLRRTLDGVGPSSRTALARAISEAAGAMSAGASADDPVSMVLISDGLDVCGGDPCAAAQRAKRARPGLIISVIDLADHRALSCVAEATGGIYMRRDESMDIDELARLTREAAGIDKRLCAPASAAGN